ncbi:hypothetical protein [Pseudomonas sp. MWU12-2323]|uniref:hypothetical protein n=1 Tax=Pseudomonas sp. MWU12-2323 TaxID=2651296 RepID=UPI00128DC0F8|nr:hypothetical protein [Pseudomonas sp. MWU12-2323]MPQ69413.1 hypothetical protein [Pseudomonas sp. MWU12-2323]
MITFSYCMDAAGNLIKLSLGKHPKALIPGAVELAATAIELAHPLPWTTTVAEALKEIRFVPFPHVKGTAAEQPHISGSIPQSAYVFVPPSESFASDEEVAELIELFDVLPAGHEGRAEITDALNAVGIQMTPLIPTFNPKLHESASVNRITEYVSPGWISHSKVYRKAVTS